MARDGVGRACDWNTSSGELAGVNYPPRRRTYTNLYSLFDRVHTSKCPLTLSRDFSGFDFTLRSPRNNGKEKLVRYPFKKILEKFYSAILLPHETYDSDFIRLN